MPTLPKIQNFDEKEPYIYVSYSQEDAEKAFPIMEKLQADGFRLWYDDGVRKDKAQAKLIKEKIRRSMFFLAFLSPSYLQSDSCKKEFQIGEEKDLSKCILIHIENAHLDSASTFFFARAQNVRWYMNADNEPLCYYVLYVTGNLDKCNIHGKIPFIPPSSIYGEDADMPGTSSSPDAPQVNTNRLKQASFIIFAFCIIIFIYLILRP